MTWSKKPLESRSMKFAKVVFVKTLKPNTSSPVKAALIDVRSAVTYVSSRGEGEKRREEINED